MLKSLGKKLQLTLGLISLTMLLFSCAGKEEVPVKNLPKMFVFELEKSPTNMKSFNSIVERLNGNLDGNFQQDKEDKTLWYTDDKANVYFEQDLSTGNLSFNKNIKKYLGDFKPDLPSSDGAEKIALGYLESNKLLPGSRKELKMLHSGGLRADSSTGKGVIDKMRTITYGRLLDGIPVIGSGSKIVVHIGDQKEVTGLVHKWREVSRKSKRLVTPEEIISEQEVRRSFSKVIASQFGKEAKATINNISLVYYDGDGRYIQPAYGVESTVEIVLSKKTVNKIPYLSIFAALKKPPEIINLRAVEKDAHRLLNKPDDQEGKRNGVKDMD